MVVEELRVLRATADFQFEGGVGRILFPAGSKIERSKRTGRPRRVYYRGRLLTTVIPSTGLLALSVYGGERLRRAVKAPRLRVTVSDDAAAFVEEGRSAFAKHVVRVDPDLRPGAEVLVVDSRDRLLAVGRALLSSDEMLSFERGVAVKIRQARA